MALEAAGFPCWVARQNGVPGTLYAVGVVGAKDESGILVLILSKEAVASAHVGRDLERGSSRRHPINALGRLAMDGVMLVGNAATTAITRVKIR